MNKVVVRGLPKEIPGQIKERWGKTTQADLDRAEGKSIQLIGLLQEKYSCTHELAELEFKRRLSQILDAGKKE